MIRWITDSLGTAAYSDKEILNSNYQIIDVRDLVDKSGNSPGLIRERINEILDLLKKGKTVVICCDYGISRSNAIAAGVLSIIRDIPFSEAVQAVISATGEKKIKVQILSVVRQALNEKSSLGLEPKKFTKTILITGGSGFLGSQLKAQLPQYNVLTPSRTEIDLSLGSIQLDSLICDEKPDCIIHLANPRIYTDNDAMGSSLVMLKNVIDVCCENSIKLIYPSSWEIYSGYRSNFLLASESLPSFPKGAYSETKALSEKLLCYSMVNNDLACLILRFSPIYGSGSDKPKFIYNFLEKSVKNEEILTHQYINGFPTLDLIHISDALSAFRLAVEKDPKGEINVGTGVPHSTFEIAQIIVRQLKSKSGITHRKIEAYAPNIVMDNTKARRVLNWSPKVSIEEGIDLLIKQEYGGLM
jgi:UDP-glucuronate decarboxylase